MSEALNPLWVEWQKAGMPGHGGPNDGHMPKAGAFMLWNNAQRRAFEAERGCKLKDEALSSWRTEHDAEYLAWLQRAARREKAIELQQAAADEAAEERTLRYEQAKYLRTPASKENRAWHVHVQKRSARLYAEARKLLEID